MRGTNEKPWSGIGVEVNRSLSSREMLYKAKLDWEVSKIPSQRPKSHSNQETLSLIPHLTLPTILLV